MSNLKGRFPGAEGRGVRGGGGKSQLQQIYGGFEDHKKSWDLTQLKIMEITSPQFKNRRELERQGYSGSFPASHS